MNIRSHFYPTSVRVPVLTGSVLAFALLLAVHPRAIGAPALPVPAGAVPASQASSTIAAAVHASTPTAAITTTDSDELALLQSRLQVLRVKKEIAEVEAAIDKAKQPASSGIPPALSGPLPAAGSPIPGTPPTDIRMSAGSDMTLVGTGSYDGRSMATLVIGGVARDVRVGDTLDDGWNVARIEGNRVQLTRAGRVRWVRL
ncbi:type IV pilus biogenesis protein PilP (plasmid) [Burkholderia sp. MS455]|uniref:type IV pilus biogenesis protein PilP n=1 Tax=Burkholderia sp. MS455 TaxID=2811788 RepID=UPI0019594A9E|nr:type IV pilus biogenesis protein PilP [Burkholderia sp. MS455]QRR11784.1 type IV pilus biogenesis protein PilP [Burkholderia sp. MS455]